MCVDKEWLPCPGIWAGSDRVQHQLLHRDSGMWIFNNICEEFTTKTHLVQILLEDFHAYEGAGWASSGRCFRFWSTWDTVLDESV